MRRLRNVALGPTDVLMQVRADATRILRSPHPLAPYPMKITERLEHWAREAPDRVALAQRDDARGWRTLTYAQARRRARRIAQWLLGRRLSAERPLLVLSGNDLEHALLEL